MRFRSRVALALGIGAMVPLLVLAFGVRREMTRRLTAQADRRIEAQIGKGREQMASEFQTIENRLARMAGSLSDNNQFRLAVVAAELSVPWIRDWAHDAMLQSDFTVLELLDSAGQVLSSGHFRNEFGQPHAGLAQAVVRSTPAAAVFRARTPGGLVDAVVLHREFDIAGRTFFLVGGRGLDLERVVASDPELSAQLVDGPSVQTDASPGASRIPLNLIRFDDSLIVAPAAIVLTRDLGPMRAIRQSIDRWFLAAMIVLLALTALLAAWLASRVTRPLAELAEKTGRVDLDRLDQSFGTGRSDEIGSLAGLLDAMSGRLRTSVIRLREAERRAATGDLARQINHDVKNGLAPIRHVLRHLTQVARERPEELATIYHERVGTLESSVEYLENLSRNYARLTPSLDRTATDPNATLRDIVEALEGTVPVELTLLEDVPRVRADAVALRRIMENLVTNALDAAREVAGQVSVRSESTHHDGASWARMTVADSGKGMTQEELNQAFDDFFTTKSGGTGLGLSVVRRLVADLGGSLRVETAPGQGSRFIVELPAEGSQ